MVDEFRHPLVVFVLSFLLLYASVWIGRGLSVRRRVLEGAVREDFGVILTATLTLLGLIIGFTFSMALTRYDQRKNYEEQEANAIGTEYVRADLLPAADGAGVKALLAKYVELRIEFYETADGQRLRAINAETARVQMELWAAVRAAAAARPDPVVALTVAGMNDVLNSQSYTQAAWWNRIPVAGWLLMIMIAVCSNVLFGYSSRFDKGKSIFYVVLPLIISVAFLLIADIDTPRRGLVHVPPMNLHGLAESLRP